MSERDDRPLYVAAAVLLLLVAGLALPATRAWIVSEVIEPLKAQADPVHATKLGYTPASLAFWAALGAALAWLAYEVVFHRMGYEPDARFFAALAPYLAFGPLAHALLAVAAFPAGSWWAYAASEPPIYLTTAVLALAGLAMGGLSKRRVAAPLALGLLFVAVLVPASVQHATRVGALRGIALLAVAVALAFGVAAAWRRYRSEDALLPVAAVVGAHALDGLTTWMVLRDPFGVGFHSFGEKNPFSLALVNLSNGWPYFVVKLALPLVLLSLVKTDRSQERQKAFLLFAIFVLGYGPGMANLLQVVFG